MSFTEKDRKIRPDDRKDFPPAEAPSHMGSFVDAIAHALRAEFGSSPSMVKAVARITSTNERAVKNWFDGKNGPSGENLVLLMQGSDEVLQTVLRLAGRHDLIVTMKVAATRTKLMEMLQMLDQLSSPEDGTSGS